MKRWRIIRDGVDGSPLTYDGGLYYKVGDGNSAMFVMVPVLYGEPYAEEIASMLNQSTLQR